LTPPVLSDERPPGELAHLGPCVVVGFHRLPDSVHVLATARDLSSRLGAHLHVLHVVGGEDYPVDPDSPGWEQAAAAHIDDLRAAATAALGSDARKWSWGTCPGDPAKVLAELAQAHGALLVVVGTRGEGVGAAVARLVGGSVTHRLLRHGAVPVLVVPPRGKHSDPAREAAR
jgi:nucleotide-binding universal stress UspA family protein